MRFGGVFHALLCASLLTAGTSNANANSIATAGETAASNTDIGGGSTNIDEVSHQL